MWLRKQCDWLFLRRIVASASRQSGKAADYVACIFSSKFLKCSNVGGIYFNRNSSQSILLWILQTRWQLIWVQVLSFYWCILHLVSGRMDTHIIRMFDQTSYRKMAKNTSLSNFQSLHLTSRHLSAMRLIGVEGGSTVIGLDCKRRHQSPSALMQFSSQGAADWGGGDVNNGL